MPLKEEIKQLMEQEGTLETVMSFFGVKESIYQIQWVEIYISNYKPIKELFDYKILGGDGEH